MATIENAIFWIETEKIIPNPYQPRREFDQDRLKELAESIKQYGILQPLVVSRQEKYNEETGEIITEYELIAGERRLRAAKLINLPQVPVVIRIGDDNREKLELAIIENLQRENLNPVERAMSFQRLADEFKLSWAEVGRKVGKSREYVSNTVRILMLPQDILDGLSKGLISEGHTRPLLMLIDRPEEQMTLYKEMLIRKMTVREAESIARRVAYEKVRKKSTFITPEVIDMEEKLAESLGTRVHIEPREKGGKISIDYFSYDELLALANLIRLAGEKKTHLGMFDQIKKENIFMMQAGASAIGAYVSENLPNEAIRPDLNTTLNSNLPSQSLSESLPTEYGANLSSLQDIENEKTIVEDDRSLDEIKQNEKEEFDIYNLKNFTI